MTNSEVLLVQEKKEEIERFEEDSAWVTQHYENLRKYEGKVVAVKNRAIISISESVEDLLKELEAKKENAACLLIEAIPPKNVSFIL
jgi:hypothetical protein